jgi:O-antigen/teichoic acid export membrane protein
VKSNFPPDYNENPTDTPVSERQSANWDVRNAPKNYISLVLTQGGSAFFSFVSVLLITKVLGPEGYGGVVAIIAASQVAQVLVNWTSVSVIRFGVDEFIETEKIVSTFWCRLFILLPNLLLVLLISNLWFPPLAYWLKLPAGSFWLIFLHFVALSLWIHVQNSLQAIKMPRLQGGLLTVERISIFASLLILLAAGKLDGTSAILCYALIPLAMTFVGLFYLRKFVFSAFSFDKVFVKRMVVFSLPLLPFSLVGYFSGGYIDAVFIANYFSTSDLGIYSIATQISGIALQFPVLANSLLNPLFISLHKENRARKLNLYFKDILPSLTLAWGFFCTFVTFAGYFFIPLIFGSGFVSSILPFWILMAGSVFSFPILVGYSALSNSLSATYIAMFAAVFSAAANIFFNFLLIPVYGVEGCAWATVIAHFISFVAFYIFLRRKASVPLSWIFPAITPSIAAAICFSLLRNPFISLSVCAIIGIFVVYLKRVSLKEAFYLAKSFRNN